MSEKDDEALQRHFETLLGVQRTLLSSYSQAMAALREAQFFAISADRNADVLMVEVIERARRR